jgi:hypothetical protein
MSTNFILYTLFYLRFYSGYIQKHLPAVLTFYEVTL